MPVEDAQRFLSAVDQDAALKDKVQVAAAGALDQVDAIAGVARAEGYDLGEDDLRTALESGADVVIDPYAADLWEAARGMTRSALLFGGTPQVSHRLNLLRER